MPRVGDLQGMSWEVFTQGYAKGLKFVLIIWSDRIRCVGVMCCSRESYDS